MQKTKEYLGNIPNPPVLTNYLPSLPAAPVYSPTPTLCSLPTTHHCSERHKHHVLWFLHRAAHAPETGAEPPPAAQRGSQITSPGWPQDRESDVDVWSSGPLQETVLAAFLSALWAAADFSQDSGICSREIISHIADGEKWVRDLWTAASGTTSRSTEALLWLCGGIFCVCSDRKRLYTPVQRSSCVLGRPLSPVVKEKEGDGSSAPTEDVFLLM